MRQRFKRSIAALLTLMMLVTMLPTTVFAAATSPEDISYVDGILEQLNEGLTEDLYKYRSRTGARLGDSDLFLFVLYRDVYDEETATTITDSVYVCVPGDGASADHCKIPDYSGPKSGQPWASANLSAIYIADGVTGIGNHAFDSVTTLTKVEIENSAMLESVGEAAFKGCDKLAFTKEEPLDLSGVTELGASAFSGCEQLRYVTLGEGLEDIPANAFNNCGLRDIEIPSGVKTIGESAFASNGFSEAGELILPEGLITIEKQAFYRALNFNEETGFKSVTIPSTVTTIGEKAFYNHRRMDTVTVQGSDNGGQGDSQLVTVGTDAFGNNSGSAYSASAVYVDPTNPELKYDYTKGTQFYLPKERDSSILENYRNCFLGDLTPLTYVRTEPPTCEGDGYHLYTQTNSAVTVAGEPLVMEVKVTINKLGHDYQLEKQLDATCETDAYDLYVCQNDPEHTQVRNIGVRGEAQGHNYVLQSVSNLDMGDGTETVFTWECQKEAHDDERDACEEILTISIRPDAVSADTTMTVGDLADRLPQVEGGTLSLEEDDLNAPVTTALASIHVKFTPDPVKYVDYTNVGAVDGFGGTDLTLAVNAELAKLDFSAVNFGNSQVFVNPDATEGSPIQVYPAGLPADVTHAQPVYSNDSGYSDTKAPVPTDTWSGTVSVTFSYDQTKYEVDETKKPGANYGFDTATTGEVTITHPYVIVEQTMDKLAAVAITPLTYDETDQETVHLSGVPYGSTIDWTWVEVDNAQNTGSGTATSSATETAIDIAPIRDAGTYTVQVEVTKEGYTPKPLAPVTVTINKATVDTPKAAATLSYTGSEQRGLAEAGTDDRYSYAKESQLVGTNAGDYTATAELKDPENYAWSEGDDDGNGSVTITWTIAKRVVRETTIGSNYLNRTVPYVKTPYTAVAEPSSATSFFAVEYSDEGTLVGKIKNTDIEAFTITNAKQTNAGVYPVEARITDFNNFYWINHPEDESYPLGTWTISKGQIVAPTIQTRDTIYDAQPYEAANVTMTHSQAGGSLLGSEGLVTLGEGRTYYATENAQDEMDGVPVDAGTYYVEPELIYDKVNYQLIGGTRTEFQIGKATLTLTAPTEGLEVSYTGSEYTVPAPRVEDLKGEDTEKDYALTYTYTFTPINGEAGSPQTANGEMKVSAAGTYKITVKVSDSCKNYTSDAVTYEFRIGASEQTVKLDFGEETYTGSGTQDDPYTVAKTLGDEPFTVTGAGYVGEVPTGMSVTYASSDNDIASVNGNGQVTLKQVTAEGQAVTITATAAGSPAGNFNEASASYTLTIGKGTPAVAVVLPDGGGDNHAYPYTGTPLEIKATVTGAAGAAEPVTAEKITFQYFKDDNGQKGEAIPDGQPTDIGTYWVQASYAGDDNYLGAQSTPVQFTISAAALSVTVDGIYGGKDGTDYDGGEHAAAISLTVTGNGATITEGLEIQYKLGEDGTYDATMPTVKDAGTYTIHYQVDVPNYGTATGQFNVIIHPRDLTVAGGVKAEKVYDGTVEADQDGTPQVSNAAESETITAAVTKAVYADKDANDSKKITVTYQLSGNVEWGNYTFGGKEIPDGRTVTATVNGKITPKDITVTIGDQEMVYNGKVPTVDQNEWSLDEGALCKGDQLTDLEIALELADGAAGAGEYAIVGEEASANYDVTFRGSWKELDDNQNAAGTFTVRPRPVTVEIGDGSGVYGDEPDQSKVTLTAVEATEENEGLVGSDTTALFKNKVKIQADKTSPVNQDGYPIGLDSGEQEIQVGNYLVTFTGSGTYTVTPRPITITMKNQESDYGVAPEIDQEQVEVTKGSNEVVQADLENGLTIQLEVYDSEGEPIDADTPAGTYNIAPAASGDKRENYTITWKGSGTEMDEGGHYGKYTVNRAEFKIAFQNSDQIQNGVSIGFQETYKNPLSIINSSSQGEVSAADRDGLQIEYSVEDGGSNFSVGEDGTVDITGTGTARINVTVTAPEGSNYTGTKTTWYELVVISSGGGATVTVIGQDQTYTGEAQELVKVVNNPYQLSITYSDPTEEELAAAGYGGADVENRKTANFAGNLPTGTAAGTYYIKWTAKDASGRYQDVVGYIRAEIDKADPTTGFTAKDVYAAYREGGTFDSTEKTELNVHEKYQEEDDYAIQYMSNDTAVAKVINDNLEAIQLNNTGTAVISARFAETENFRAMTVSFTLHVQLAETQIQFEAEDYEITYDGEPHGGEIKVMVPSEYEIRYSDDEGNSYNLETSPAVTNVSEGELTIYFQIQAKGYDSIAATQTVTITPKSIEGFTVGNVGGRYTYTGGQITTPGATLADGNVLLEKGVDYRVAYGDNEKVGYSQEESLATGGGYVKFTGQGNYTGEIVRYFEIDPVEATYLSAELDRYFGYFGEGDDNATVTVRHGAEEVDRDEITLSVAYTDGETEIDDALEEGYAEQRDLTLTFRKAGIYTITVAVEGAHEGEFTLRYTLLPRGGAGGVLTAQSYEEIVTYDGENHGFAPVISAVEGTGLTLDADYDLTYRYTPFTDAAEAVNAGTPYDPEETELVDAGLYVITVTGKGDYQGTLELPILVSQRNLNDGVDAEIEDGLIYDGGEQAPDVTLTFGGEKITALEDTQYFNNVNAGEEAQAVSQASADSNNFTGMRVDEFAIEPADLEDEDRIAVGEVPKQDYTGSPVIPTLEITDSQRPAEEQTLILNVDYTVEADNEGRPGEAAVTVTGVGNYTGEIQVTFVIGSDPVTPPETNFELKVTPTEWTWDDDVTPEISVTFNGTELELGTDYALTLGGVTYDGTQGKTLADAEAALAEMKPGTYEVKAEGIAPAYDGRTASETVDIQKIQTSVSITADPTSRTGSGTVTLTISGRKLPADTDLTALVRQTAGDTMTLSSWEEQNDGSYQATFNVPNVTETYTFAIRYAGNDYYAGDSDTASIRVTRYTTGGGSSGGGGGGGGGSHGGGSSSDRPDAEPDDTGVSRWLNTEDHIAYLSGYPGNTFGPDNSMTRAEVAQMFYALLNKKNVVITKTFPDVPEDAWYATAVNTLASLGMVSGDANGNYRPNDPITRAEFCVIALAFAYEPEDASCGFYDVFRSDWFYPYVAQAAAYGWIGGYANNTFGPNDNITRAQVTTIVNNMLERAADQDYVDDNRQELTVFLDVPRSHWAYYQIMEATNEHDYTRVRGEEHWR